MARMKRFKVPKITTVIGGDTEIEGNIVFTGGMHIDGTVRGNVVSDQDQTSALILSDKGLVTGDVRVPNAILNGKVVGDVVSSQRVELYSEARITGTLSYNLLEMAMGAEVNGQLVYVEEDEPRRLSFSGETVADGIERSAEEDSELKSSD